jgi:hypothetical protein
MTECNDWEFVGELPAAKTVTFSDADIVDCDMTELSTIKPKVSDPTKSEVRRVERRVAEKIVTEEYVVVEFGSVSLRENGVAQNQPRPSLIQQLRLFGKFVR